MNSRIELNRPVETNERAAPSSSRAAQPAETRTKHSPVARRKLLGWILADAGVGAENYVENYHVGRGAE